MQITKSNPLELFDLAQSKKYWSKLNSHLSIRSSKIDSGSLNRANITEAVTNFQRQGWFEIPGIISTKSLTPLYKGIYKLRQNGWLPLFIFLYDEPWLLVRSRILRNVLRKTLGKGAVQRAHFWANFVSPEGTSSGWKPHIDLGGKVKRGASLNSITLWIPLSESTLENGCIYLIPKGDDFKMAEKLLSLETLSQSQVTKILHRVRAVPAKAGSLLGWDGKILHWGSFSSEKAPTPRLSLAMEFQDNALVGGHSFSLETLPTFEERLFWIAKQIQFYYRDFQSQGYESNFEVLAMLLTKGLEVLSKNLAIQGFSLIIFPAKSF